MTLQLLAVDSDEALHDVYRVAHGRRGFDVRTALDGEEALAALRSESADVVLSDVVLPLLDGWDLVQAVREDPGLASVAFVFVSSLDGDEHRIRAFELGADDFVTRPFDLDELALRARNAAQRSEQTRAARRLSAESGGRDLAGDLSELGLGAILAMLELERKSGTLHLDEGRTGRLWIEDGRVLAAEAPDPTGGPTLRGESAVSALFGRGEGAFRFAAGAIEVADEIGKPTTHLLMDAARLDDEAQREP